MKFDLNHIDDVFKDGLENYSEQPSPGSWKKISSRMLWDDIIHLRFGNIPKAWLGAAAGVAILAVVLSLWLTSGGDNPSAPAVHPDEIVSTPGQKPGQPVNDQTITGTPQQDITLDTPEKKQSGSESSRHVMNKITLPGDAGEPLTADEPQQLITQMQSSGAETEITGKSASAIANIIQGNQVSGIEQAAQDAESLQGATSKQPPAENTGRRKNAGTPEKVVGSTPASTPTASGVAVATENTPETTDLPSNQESASTTLNQTAGEAGKIIHSGETEQTLSGRNKNAVFPGKIPGINAVSFSTGQSINYGRRPVERNFTDPPAFMYRGYKPYWTISAYFEPEVTEYYRVASESRENSYSGGIALSYNTEHYVIQAGLEISRSNDLGDYLVNIHSYDSIGYYNGVSGFEVDPENPEELIFNTHTVEVWDTVQHHSHQQTQNAYTYLQVPVMLGYKALESGRFSAHIKAGPSFSFLLNRREPGLEFHASGNARIAGIDNFTAPRIQTNVQVLVSLALQMQFTERFGLLVEPTYRYYLNTVYDVNDESLKNPYGVGVRGGVFFNF